MARERIGISADGRHFVGVSSGRRFVAWGCNYDHDETGRLLEDYWVEDWSRIEADFAEMRHLGANLVRIHLQFGRFIPAPGQPDAEALARLRRLIDLAEETGLYLDITGLGCYHRADTPAWYDEASEEQRWAAQAAFWQAVATVGAGRPAVFCYDLMNEPILPGVGKPEKDWLAGEFGGKHFVQRIALDLGERTREEVAGAWVRSLVQAIRKRDRDSLITVGVIPWALTFPKARPLFHGAAAGADLDFVSIHVYPRKGEIDRAVEALATYDVGKPILIEEMFPLHCSADELLDFVERSRPTVDGWVSFYWGTTAEEYAARPGIPAALKREWLRRFAGKAEEMKERPERTP
ncbi:MAG: cellulase family glycosylhydrolase [Lentisphaeria bacterium]|nr:cellulase family glycosylhydrolase [Lentisphaeria bacterium]